MTECDIEEGLILRVVGVLILTSCYLAGLLEHDDVYSINKENNFHQYDGPAKLESIKTNHDFWILVRVLYFALCSYTVHIVAPAGRKKLIPRLKISVYKVNFPISFFLDFFVLVLFLETRNNKDLILIRPFLDIASIYNLYYSEVTFIFRYLTYKLIDFVIRFGGLRIAICTIALLIHAILLVFALKLVGTRCFEYVLYFTDSENFMTLKYCKDLKEIQQIENIDNVTGNTFYTATSRYYVRSVEKINSYSLSYETSFNLILVDPKSKLPFSDQKHMRTIHEDVEFTCSYRFICTECLNKNETTFWSKDDVLFENDSDFVKTTTYYSEIEHSYWTSTSSTLLIHDIKETDYGEYRCLYRKWLRHDDKFLELQSIVIGRYHLVPRVKEVSFIKVPLGNKIELQWCPLHLETEDIEHTHFVDSRSITGSNDRRENKCSALPYFYHILSYYTGMLNVPKPRTSDVPSYSIRDRFKFVSIWLSTCANLEVYGTHNISITREVYDAKIGRTQLVEVEHPMQKVILPKAPYVYSYDNKTALDTSYDLNKMSKGYTESDSVLFTVRIVAEGLLFLFLSVIVLRVITIIWLKYRQIVIFPIRNFILSYRNSVRERENTFKIAILCSEKDSFHWDTARLHLIEHLTDTEILFIHRDIEHCAGKSIFEIYGDLFSQANAVIIHLTHSFIDDPECLHLHMYSPLALVKEGRIPSENVLLIHGDGCSLPDDINIAIPDVVIHDWMQTRGKEEQLHCINKWIIYVKSRVRNMDNPNRNTVSSFIL